MRDAGIPSGRLIGPFTVEEPDRLVWHTQGGKGETMLGLFLTAAAVALLWGVVSIRHATYSYKFGPISPTFRLWAMVLGALLALFVGGGGIYLWCARSGVVVDRRRGVISIWSRCLWSASEKVYSLGEFQVVEILRARVKLARGMAETCPVYPVAVRDANAGRLLLVPTGRDLAGVRRFAGELASFLALPMEERSVKPAGKIPLLALGQQAAGSFLTQWPD